jgi:hypothetical protein
MFASLKLRGLFAIFAAIFVSAVAVAAQAKVPATTPVAPVPPQIVAAQKVFISNGGSDCIGKVQDQLGGDPNEAYDEFYAGMKQLARYELVSDPGQSDLVFELHFSCQPAVSPTISDFDGQFRLTIYDAKSRFAIWVLSEHMEIAFRSATAKKNFKSSVAALVNDVKTLAAPGATPSAP